MDYRIEARGQNGVAEFISNDNNVVSVVTSFRLLGVILDSKSSTLVLAATCMLINRKLFSIKRLFYLSTSVKLQFFKTFLLPYFDYCISLAVYFSKATLQKWCTCYYASLFKLFKFDFTDLESNQINDRLKSYGLFAFQHRVFYASLFSHTKFSLNILRQSCVISSHSQITALIPMYYHLKVKRKY